MSIEVLPQRSTAPVNQVNEAYFCPQLYFIHQVLVAEAELFLRKPSFPRRFPFQNGKKLRRSSTPPALPSLWVGAAPVNAKPKRMAILLWQTQVHTEGPLWGLCRQGGGLHSGCLKRTLGMSAPPPCDRQPLALATAYLLPGKWWLETQVQAMTGEKAKADATG